MRYRETMTPPARRSGLLLPLFSMPSSRSWGIGEIGDIAPMARWLSRAGQRLLQLLPINEMPPGETSPYSALSAMAIDPQYIALDDLEDFAASGGEQGLGAAFRQLLDSVRAAPRVEYAHVRQLKHAALRRAFARFRDTEWTTGSRRAAAFRAYLDDQRWWLDDYGLFRALHARHAERAWTDWPELLRRRDPAALDAVREDLADDILYRQYLQWVADGQWARAREGAGDVALFGDLPFMVSGDSADVWARQDEFRLDASVGVPPDAFSETGQDWGLPAYRWDVLAGRDFDWLRHRARRNADLFDGYRVDHLVGFYRTYVIPHDGGQPQFTPEGEDAQCALGEQVLAVFRDAGAEIIAEDLGTVPDFVRESLARIEVPGYRVLRWEREWEVDGQPFRDPARYPAAAVATSGTHDTEPLVVWWAGAPSEEREAVLEIPYLREHLSADERARAVAEPSPDGRLREALLGTILASGAGLVILPIQDAFGWRDRINQPATVGRENWTWRLPWPVDRLTSEPEARAVAAQLREWSRASGR
jgi:4-alpha-glucanotransferase